jgi:pyrroloquinoline-quinone synthase
MMISEMKITETLNASIDGFMAHCSFFSLWKPGAVTPEMSKKFLTTFDSLVKSFPALIAAGTARVPDEAARVVLAVNLYQECGEGDLSRTHHAIYRKFLLTAGVAAAAEENPFAVQWRAALLDYILKTENIGSALGALAAGEFLAQPALTQIYAVIQGHFPKADQEYFTKHLTLETEHVREMTALLARQAKSDQQWEKVKEGFLFGLSVWGNYFDALRDFVSQTPAAASPGGIRA